MLIHHAKPLFAWDCLEDSPSLKTLRDLLATLPDGPLLESLRQARGKGRNDYPVSVLWGVVVLTVALRHVSTEACLAELRRNEPLRRLIGIESETDVPSKWNISRFEETLGEQPHRTLLKGVFETLVRNLAEAEPTLGRRTAGDSTALSARPTKSAKSLEAERGLAQPTGGRKEYTDDTGRVTKVHEWRGFKLHLLVDAEHEVALSYEITSANVGDGETLVTLLEHSDHTLPQGRIDTLAYDKAADSNEVHERLDARGIRPLVQMRSLWQSEPERKLPDHGADSNIVYDEAGTVFCYDLNSQPPVRHGMSYLGHEPERGTLKYRCPAKHEGWACPMSSVCNAGKSYGLTVRVKREIDLRRFPPIPRATKQFEKLYKGRTAVERVNSRLKVFWGADDGNVVGSRRFHAKVGVVMAVHAAFATLLATVRRTGQPSVGTPANTPRHTLGAIRLDRLAHPRHNTPEIR